MSYVKTVCPECGEEFNVSLHLHKIPKADFYPGDKVHYQPEHYGDRFENGIVKEVRQGDNGCFVVYNCGGNWDEFENYTAAKTDYRDLKRGWK